MGVYGENNILTLCRVSENATSALEALIGAQAPKQHGPFDNCFMAMCAFTFGACHLRAADLREVANYSLDPSAQVDVFSAVRIELG